MVGGGAALCAHMVDMAAQAAWGEGRGAGGGVVEAAQCVRVVQW